MSNLFEHCRARVSSASANVRINRSQRKFICDCRARVSKAKPKIRISRSQRKFICDCRVGVSKAAGDLLFQMDMSEYSEESPLLGLLLRIRCLFGSQPLSALYDFSCLRDAFDRDVVIGGSIGGVELDDGTPRLVEFNRRVPVERRAVVGNHRAAGLLRRVCRSVEFRRGLVAQRGR